MVERAVDVPEAEEFGPSTSSSATRDNDSPTMSGKPAWRAGKKGVRRLQRDVCVLLLRRQVPLVPAAAARDGAWGGLGATGLLLLRPVPAELSSLRRGVGPGGRGQPRPDAAGRSGGDVAAVRRCGSRPAAAVRRGAAVGLDGAARHGRGGRAFTGAAEGGADGRADAAGAGLDRRAGGRATGGVCGPGCVQRADARHRGEPGRASDAVHRLAVYAGQGTHPLSGRF